MSEKKDFEIVFAPGCFDTFDGTQEELDELLASIHTMFEGKTADEIKAMSRPLSDEDYEDLPDAVRLQLDGEEVKRPLQ